MLAREFAAINLSSNEVGLEEKGSGLIEKSSVVFDITRYSISPKTLGKRRKQFGKSTQRPATSLNSLDKFELPLIMLMKRMSRTRKKTQIRKSSGVKLRYLRIVFWDFISKFYTTI
jgi:hypothetical protein